MIRSKYDPAATGFARLFGIVGGARADRDPMYWVAGKLGAFSKEFGGITKIEMPSPRIRDEFEEVGVIKGTSDRGTSAITARFPASVKSLLMELGDCGKMLDLILTFGKCHDPEDYNQFDKAVLLEKVYITNYSTDELGALESGERSPINESSNISIGKIYEIIPWTYKMRAGNTVTVEIKDVTIKEPLECDEGCSCKYMFAVSAAAGGSPGTPPDVIYSLDGGETWSAHDIDTLTDADDADGIAIIGEYVVVISNGDNSLHYADLQDFEDGIDPSFTEVTPFSAAPIAIISVGQKGFIVCDAGYIYGINSRMEITELDDGSASSSNALQDVDALDEYISLAGGNNGYIVWTDNRDIWTATTQRPVGDGVTINAVAIRPRNEEEFWAGADDGSILRTLNRGRTWTEVTLPGDTPSNITDIKWVTDMVLVVTGVVDSNSAIWKSIDGGRTFIREPQGEAVLPNTDIINAMDFCKTDPNLLLFGGLADDATDGFLMMAED